jgi:hypothetical protein
MIIDTKKVATSGSNSRYEGSKPLIHKKHLLSKKNPSKANYEAIEGKSQ